MNESGLTVDMMFALIIQRSYTADEYSDLVKRCKKWQKFYREFPGAGVRS